MLRRMTEPRPTRLPPTKTFAVTLFLIVCALGLAADLFTKWLAFEHPSTKLFSEVVRDTDRDRWETVGSDAMEVRLIPRLLHFHATVNEGAVFGIGQGQRTLFVLVSLGAIAFLIFLVTRTQSRFEVALYGCLLAGVLGNMYDRVRYAYVRDMILALPDVHWPGTWSLPIVHYPAADRLMFPYIFNVADCLLVCGVGVLLIRSFLPAKRDDVGDDAKLTP